MKTNYTTINPTTQAILASKFNIFQIQKRVERALKLSDTCRDIIDRHSKPELTQYPPKRAEQAVSLARLVLRRCNAVLGDALNYLTYHNAPCDDLDTSGVAPYRDATPHRLRTPDISIAA